VDQRVGQRRVIFLKPAVETEAVVVRADRTFFNGHGRTFRQRRRKVKRDTLEKALASSPKCTLVTPVWKGGLSQKSYRDGHSIDRPNGFRKFE
jgi:hypothetical protein